MWPQTCLTLPFATRLVRYHISHAIHPTVDFSGVRRGLYPLLTWNKRSRIANVATDQCVAFL